MARGSGNHSRTPSRLSRRRLLASAGTVTAAGAALLAGCSSKANRPATAGTAAGPVKRGGTLSTFITTEPAEDFEPHGTRSQQSSVQQMLALSHSGLLRLKVGEGISFADHTIEAALASKWEQPDPQTLVFHLRPGVKFHDKPPVGGREVNAADVKFSFERLLGSPFAYVNYFSSIASVDAQDAQTAVIKLKAPDAALLGHIGTGFAWIMAKEAGKANPKGSGGLSFQEPATAIGTGPFMVDSYEHGIKAHFVRNPNYFEAGLPYLDRVEFQFITDTSAQLAALQSGQAVMGNLPAGSEADFRARNPKLLYAANYSSMAWHHAMRVDQKPFTDVRVRRALAMAYNQEAVKKVWGAPDAPSSYGSLTAIMGDAYLPLDRLGDDAKWWKLDAAAAKQLLAAAGYPNGFETDYNSSNCCQPQFLEEQLASDFAKIGLKLNIKIKEHAAFLATTNRGQYDGMAGNQVPVYDPNDWFALTMLAGSPRNISHVDDPKVNELSDRQRAELDPRKRLEIIHELERYLAGQVYYLVEPQLVQTEVHRPVLRNYAPRLGYQPTLMVAWLDK